VRIPGTDNPRARWRRSDSCRHDLMRAAVIVTDTGVAVAIGAPCGKETGRNEQARAWVRRPGQRGCALSRARDASSSPASCAVMKRFERAYRVERTDDVIADLYA